MERSKVDAIFQWVQLLLDDKTIDSIGYLSDIKILLKVLKLVDKDVWMDEYTDDASGRLECILSYLEGIYGGLRTAISKTAILARDEFETIKLLVVILVAAVNSESVSFFVEPIMKLARPDQMSIMSVISPINERTPEKDLDILLNEVLCSTVNDDESQLAKSPSSFIFSPGVSTYSPYPSFMASPVVNHIRNNSHSSSVGVDSPFKFMVSPRVVSKKELFEKNKMNVRIRRLESNVKTQVHVIDELEQKLEETKKKNEMLESINADMKARVKGLSTLQNEIDALKMVRIELETKDIELQRINDRCGEALKENASLKAEMDMILKQSVTEREETTVKLRKVSEKCEKLQSSEDSLKVKNAELLNSIKIREDECLRIAEEKEQECKELLDHVSFLKEKLVMQGKNTNNEESFVVLGEEQQCLKNELHIVELEEDLKKSNEELKSVKEKYESSTKLVFELKNQLNESQSKIVSQSKDFEAKTATFTELKIALENELQCGKEREDKAMSQVTDLELIKEELELKINSMQNENCVLRREKEATIISCSKEKDNLERLLHEQEIKVRSVELQVANLQCEKDNLEKVSKDRCIEFTRKLERAEENHAVECYQIKENFQKKICELEEVTSEKNAEANKAKESYDSLIKTKRLDDEIFVQRISALIEERDNAVGCLTIEMNEKIDDIIKEKEKLTSEIELLKNQKEEVKIENHQLAETINVCQSKIDDITEKLQCALSENEKQSLSIMTLEKELRVCRDEVSGFKDKIERMNIEKIEEEEKVKLLEVEKTNMKSELVAMQQENEALQKTIEVLDNEIEVYSQTCEAKQAEITAKEIVVNELQKEKVLMESQHEVDLKSLRNQVDAVLAEKATVEENLSSVEQECQDLKTTNSEIKANAEKVISDANNRIATLIKEKSHVETVNNNFELELESIKGALGEKANEIACLNVEICEIKEVSVKQNEEKCRELSESIERGKVLELSVDQLNYEMNDIIQQSKNMEADYTAKVSETEAKRKEMEDKNSELRCKLEKANKEIDDRQEKVVSLEKEMEKVNFDFKERIFQLSKEMSDTQQDLQEQISKAQVEMKAKEEERIRLEKEHSLKMAEKEELLEGLQKSQSGEIEMFQIQYKKMEEDIRNISSILDKERKEFEMERKEFKSTLSRLDLDHNAKIEEEKQEAMEIKIQMESLELEKNEEIMVLKTEYEMNEMAWLKDKNRLEEQLKCMKEKKDEIICEAESEKRKVIEENRELSNAQEVLQNEMKAAKIEIAEAEAELDKERKNSKSLGAKIEMLELQNDERMKELTAKYEKEKAELKASKDYVEHVATGFQRLRCHVQSDNEIVAYQGNNMTIIDENDSGEKLCIEEEGKHMKELTLEDEYLVGTAEAVISEVEKVDVGEEDTMLITSVKGNELNPVSEQEAVNLLRKFQAEGNQRQPTIAGIAELASENMALMKEQYNITKRLLREKECLLAEVRSTKEDIFAITKKNEELSSTLLSKQDEMDKSSKANAEILQDAANEKETLDLLIESQERTIHAKCKEIEAVHEKMDKLNADLEYETSVFREEREELSTELENARVENAEIVFKLSNTETELADVKVASAKVLKNMEKLTADSKELTNQITVLRNEAELKDKVIKETNEKINFLEGQGELTEEKVLKQRNVIEEQTMKIESSGAELLALQKENARSENLVKDLENEVKILQEKIGHVDEQKAEIARANKDLISELQSVKTQITDITNENNGLLHDLTNTKNCFQKCKKLMLETLELEEEVSQNIEGDVNYFQKMLVSLVKDNAYFKSKDVQYESEKSCLRTKINNLEESIVRQSQVNEKKELDFEEEKKNWFIEIEYAKKELEESKAEIERCKGNMEVVLNQQEIKLQKELKTKLNEMESECKAKIVNLQENLAASDEQMVKIKTQSKKTIDELQQELDEMSYERTRMEADLAKYKTRLEDIESSMQVFERKTESMKKKMQCDMLQLMKDYQEKENAFEEERRMLQSTAERAEKDAIEGKQMLQKYSERIGLLEAELKNTKLKIADENCPRDSIQQIRPIEPSANTLISDSCMGQQHTVINQRQTSLVGNPAIQGDTANLSFDEQSTLVCDDLTIKRSPSVRSLNINEEDAFGGSITSLESVTSIDSNISRARSLRRQSGIIGGPARRRSLLYMAGKTPPERRTTLSVAMPCIPACQMEDEPDILESKGFDDDIHRISELKRRNTLCLPHLKSSYPLEVIATESIKDVQDSEYEASVRNSFDQSKKRKSEDEKKLLPPKRKANNTSRLDWSRDTATRTVKSGSNIVTRSMINEGSQMIWGDSARIKDETQFETTIDPRRESIAFSIDFDEPKKKLKPRGSLRRSRGSAHLFTIGSKESLSASKESLSSNIIVNKVPTKRPSKIQEKENRAPVGRIRRSETPSKQSDNKTSLKSRTNNFRKSIRKSISKVRGTKPAV